MTVVRRLAILLSGALVVGSVLALSSVAVAVTSSARNCSGSQVGISATVPQANYTPGTPITVTISLHNHSTRACRFNIGPFSPSFTLVNSSGTTVWASCWYGGGPAPCAMYLIHRTLAPGATYRTHATWDQKTGHPDTQVPPGVYRFSADYNGVAVRAHTAFSLVGSPHTFVVTNADNGHHYILAVGDHLELDLSAMSLYVWTAPVSSNPLVLSPVSDTNPSWAPSSAGVTLFLARGAGTATVSATENPSCSPECMMPSRLFSVSVTVVS